MMKRTVSMIIAICMVAVFVVPFFSVSAFAAIDPSIEIPYNQPGLKMFNCNHSNFDEIYITKRSLDYDADVVAYYDNNQYHFVACSYTNNGLADYRLILSSNGHQYNYVGFYLNDSYAYGGTTYYYHDQTMDSGLYITQCVIPLYDNFTEAIEACIDGLNYTPPPTTYPYTFSVGAGYVAYVHVSGSTTVELTCKMPDLSQLWVSGPEPKFWSGDYATLGYSLTMPSVGDRFNDNTFIYIDWERGSDRNNYNQTKTAVYSNTWDFDSNGEYLIIYNPPYYDKGDSQILSPTISVSIDAIEVNLFAVTNSIVAGVETKTITSAFDVGVTGNITDSSGDPAVPETGGGNYVPDQSDQTSVLDNLVSGISSFFQGSWLHIRTLTEAISGFPELMGQIFAGLPTDVVSIIVSFFGVLIVLGIVKALL